MNVESLDISDMKLHNILLAITAVATLAVTNAVAKPLKVYILVGQSNMEGHAQTKTFPAIAKDPKTADIYKEMVDAEGKPIVCEDVYISYSYGNFAGDAVGKKHGKLTAGYGSQHHVGTGKIGPEFTFGIYMQKLVDEPILIIKTAWGGKSLHTDFRPPSAGPYYKTTEGVKDRKTHKGEIITAEKQIADKIAATGVNYRLMMEHVKEVLADPKKVYPDYDAKEGYELAGFVWFQGFNDLVGPYPNAAEGKGKDYSAYTSVLASFIRDVRKDLSAPNMPFVTGVLGVGGEEVSEGALDFRKAMAAPAEMEEFKGNVVNVYTEKYWPAEIDKVSEKINKIKAPFNKQFRELKAKKLSRAENKKAQDALNAEIKVLVDKALTEDEKFLMEFGKSNQGFHYWGSAKCFAQIGKAFAEAVAELNKGK